MTLQERLERLEPRERRLLGILAAVLGAFLVVLGPVGLVTMLSSHRADNQALRDAINAITDGRERVAKRNADREAILKRYARKAPALAGFLEKEAKRSTLEIPESQDLAPVPHGKQYEERSTKIVLRRVGMYNLVKFMERIAASGFPVAVSRLNVRKRGAGNDAYDVQMIVSAFDRIAKDKKSDQEDNANPEESDEEVSDEASESRDESETDL